MPLKKRPYFLRPRDKRNEKKRRKLLSAKERVITLAHNQRDMRLLSWIGRGIIKQIRKQSRMELVVGDIA